MASIYPQLCAEYGPFEPWQQMALAAGLIERMQPNFALFCEVSGHPGAGVYSNILNLVWDHLSGSGAAVDFEKQQLKLDAVIPDPQQFDMYGVWPALDATAALTALLSCCEQFDQDEIASIFAVSEGTIAGFVEATEGSVADQHPLQEAEQAFIQAMVEALQPANGARKSILAALRELARETGSSNIGLSLD